MAYSTHKKSPSEYFPNEKNIGYERITCQLWHNIHCIEYSLSTGYTVNTRKCMPKISKPLRRPWQPELTPFESGRARERWGGYNGTRWRTISRLFKEQNPVCCVEGCGRPTYYADHDVPALDCDDPYDVANLRPLCRRCGDRKSGREGAVVKRVGGRGM